PNAGTGDTPRFDMILLGMGADGHTASLFPGTAALGDTQRLVVANEVPKLGATRLTFTYRLINAARRVLILVSGAEKAAVLREVLNGPRQVAQLPVQGVQPIKGTVTWLVDEAAYGEVSKQTE
ncbi:MAG: 6-phosphogluconolactonase, partial [Caldilineaceae bacterium]|nr:6-phosphogluconolactonase [Caldilineaceae bacterium]